MHIRPGKYLSSRVVGWVGGWIIWKYNQLSPKLGWVGAWAELGNIFRTGLNNAFTSQEALTKTAGLHKLQISVIQEEFYTYTQVVDSLEDKLCQLFPHAFASTLPSQQDAMSPSPMPTPPSSNVKKKDFR